MPYFFPFAHLQEQYSRAVNQCNFFSARLDDVLAENKALRRIAADYEQVKRTFSSDEVERAAEDAKCRKAVEKRSSGK